MGRLPTTLFLFIWSLNWKQIRPLTLWPRNITLNFFLHKYVTFFKILCSKSGDTGESRPQQTAQWHSCLRHCTTSPRVRSRWCHWNLLLTFSFRPHCSPGVNSNSNRNEYQEYFLGANGWCVRLTNFRVSFVLKSGSLKLLEPSGFVQVLFYLYL